MQQAGQFGDGWALRGMTPVWRPLGEPRQKRRATSPTPGTMGGGVTSHPLAVEAGLETLDAGGGAVDAAVVAAVVLAVIDLVHRDLQPTSSRRRRQAPRRAATARFLSRERSSMIEV